MILLDGAATATMDELSSHAVLARGTGLDATKIRTTGGGQRPADLTDEESIAYGMADVLLRGRRPRTRSWTQP